jgi:hypothetical protein
VVIQVCSIAMGITPGMSLLFSSISSIDIQRFKCPSCNKTYSRLPCCLIPYFIYSFDVVIFCLYCVYALANKAAYVCKLLHSINPYSFITPQSISFLKRDLLPTYILPTVSSPALIHLASHGPFAINTTPVYNYRIKENISV